MECQYKLSNLNDIQKHIDKIQKLQYNLSIMELSKEDQLKLAYDRLLNKIMRFTEARRIAETTFRNLREGPDWIEFCRVNDLSTSCDFGDLTC